MCVDEGAVEKMRGQIYVEIDFSCPNRESIFSSMKEKTDVTKNHLLFCENGLEKCALMSLSLHFFKLLFVGIHFIISFKISILARKWNLNTYRP